LSIDKFVAEILNRKKNDLVELDKDKLIGQVVEVRADAITQNQNAKDEWSLRFPRFLRFRGFEVGEKL